MTDRARIEIAGLVTALFLAVVSVAGIATHADAPKAAPAAPVATAVQTAAAAPASAHETAERSGERDG
jgi:hypothetical protein